VKGNKRMEWVTSKRHMTAEHRLARAVQTLQADVHSSPASTDAPADLNGLVRFAERRNLVSMRVPSHFKRSLHRRPHGHCLRIANVISFTDSIFREVKMFSCTEIKEVHCGPIRMQNNTIDRFRGPEIVSVTYIKPQHERNVYGGRVS